MMITIKVDFCKLYPKVDEIPTKNQLVDLHLELWRQAEEWGWSIGDTSTTTQIFSC